MGRPRGLVCGVGINDADYVVRRRNPDGSYWLCPYYHRWTNILIRCYNKFSLEKRPTYVGCSVCPEWIYFMNFRSWMEKQGWEGKHLDKDIITQGNKVYSPEKLCFHLSAIEHIVS